jgi:hypothetical protein
MPSTIVSNFLVTMSNFLSTYDKMALKLVKTKLFKRYKNKESQESNNETLKELLSVGE